MSGLIFVIALLGCGPGEAPAPSAPVAAAPPADPWPSADRIVVERKRKELYANIRAFVADLEAVGRYDCCVKVPCTHCAVLAGGCACGEGARKGEPVCEECAYLWMQGQGAEPEVSKDSVRSFLEASRAKQAPKAPGCCEEDKRGSNKPGTNP